jgi:hypothetical protein
MASQPRPAAPGHDLAPVGRTHAQSGRAKTTAGHTEPAPTWPHKKRLAAAVSSQPRPAAPGHGLAPAGRTQAQPNCYL